MKRNLIITRVGDTSLHPGWMAPESERNWDIIVSYYGNTPDIFKDEGVRRMDLKGPKWPALHELVGKLQPEIDAYDYVLFPDDDLVANAGTFNKFFDTCHEFKLKLAQPSLDIGGIIGCPITTHNRAFRLRFTTFVEIMAPCLSREFLKRCWPSFNTNVSGQGLDYLWPNWVGDSSKCAIIDEVSVKHMRSKGELYDVFKALGADPREEMSALVRKEGLYPVPMTLGGITKEGQLHAVWNKGHDQLIRHLMLGWLPEMGENPELLYQLIAPILLFLQAESQKQQASS
jgi:hypothetical protein